MLTILRALPMVRTTFFSILVLALLAVSAGAAPAHRIRAHRSTVSAGASHRTARSASGHKTHYAARRRTRRTSRYSTRYRAAAREWEAGRRNIAFHVTRRRRTTTPEAPASGTSEPEADVPEAAASDLPAPETPDSTNPIAINSRSEAETIKTPASHERAARIPTPPTENPVAPAPAETAALDLRSTRIFAMPPLRGSLASLERQNEKTEADGLERILDDNDLNDRIARGMLVPVPASPALTVNAELPPNRRYCRPWTARFLNDLARAHDAQFHHPLEVSSAVRTVAYQKRLMEINGNAAQAEGDIASPHLTGATIDIAKEGLSQREIYWMRDRLARLQDEGKIDVEEEFQQACFHITVYKNYVAPKATHKVRRRPAAPPPDKDDAPEPAESSAEGL
ncbi:MAG: DUF5715 family protein [Terracidiphilus sp.]